MFIETIHGLPGETLVYCAAAAYYLYGSYGWWESVQCTLIHYAGVREYIFWLLRGRRMRLLVFMCGVYIQYTPYPGGSRLVSDTAVAFDFTVSM